MYLRNLMNIFSTWKIIHMYKMEQIGKNWFRVFSLRKGEAFFHLVYIYK